MRTRSQKASVRKVIDAFREEKRWVQQKDEKTIRVKAADSGRTYRFYPKTMRYCVEGTNSMHKAKEVHDFTDAMKKERLPSTERLPVPDETAERVRAVLNEQGVTYTEDGAKFVLPHESGAFEYHTGGRWKREGSDNLYHSQGIEDFLDKYYYGKKPPNPDETVEEVVAALKVKAKRFRQIGAREFEVTGYRHTYRYEVGGFWRPKSRPNKRYRASSIYDFLNRYYR